MGMMSMVALIIQVLLQVLSFLRAMWVLYFNPTRQIGDGREEALLKHVLKEAPPNDPEGVLECMDRWSAHVWMMNIGGLKGALLRRTLLHHRPSIVLELGSYCGYSSVLLASQLVPPHCLLISVEINPANCDITRAIVAHAGLSSRVKVLQGVLKSCLDEIKTILARHGNDSIDFVFLDHYKEAYLPDYLILKDSGLLKKGSVIFADNMGFPGSPYFLKYLISHPMELQTVQHHTQLEYLSWLPDKVTISTFMLDSSK